MRDPDAKKGPITLRGCPELSEEEKHLARVCADPGQWCRRRSWPDGFGGKEYEDLSVWQARAILVASASGLPGTNFDKVPVTVALTPDDMPDADKRALRGRVVKRHAEAADEVTVLVPPGLGGAARDMVWAALGTARFVPENVGPHGAQDGDYIRRAYGSW